MVLAGECGGGLWLRKGAEGRAEKKSGGDDEDGEGENRPKKSLFVNDENLTKEK